MEWIDAIGQAHRPDPQARIVSLVPSVTEMLCDFGLAPQLVGRTGFCVHPAEQVRAIAKVGGTKDVNLDKLRRLAPSHVVVNIDENEKPTVDQIAAMGARIVVTHPLAPRDNLALAALLGGVFCRQAEAAAWSAQFSAALAGLRPGTPRRVLYCIWKDPWMTVSRDTYIANMLASIGWQVPTLGTARYPAFDWTPQLLAELDLILLSSEPYRFTEADATALAAELGKPVWLVDGEMLSWYGTRALAGLHYLQALAAR
ncbi:helical backbone metal receptor [Massilia sp. TS11]|uniref:helical backbone metal receptor n=1 Tax=Massilia sp. TS11 TaxID=2908003 RepID=UPI001ED9FA1E|nr:helical backbone metal receptor [Massilia sp. TS11]MCG2585725.1 helical backbone metal receptor [Massilia sp. TS11]